MQVNIGTVIEYKKLPGWKKLDPYTRCEIILVSEGVKKGATSGDPNEELFIKTLDRLELYHSKPERTEQKGEVTFVVRYAKEKSHLDKFENAIPLDQTAGHILSGEFHGYDRCCINKYFKDEEAHASGKPFKGFPDQMKELIEREGEYPEELDYRVLTFTPCDPKCPNALKTLRKWKETLEKHDPDAAKALREENKGRWDWYLKKKQKK